MIALVRQRLGGTMPEKKTGVLVISHGSRDRDWVRLVDEAVADMALPEDIPVVSAFLECVEGRLIQDGIDELERAGVTDIVVLPLFISSGSTHMHEIGYALGFIPDPLVETDLKPFRKQASVRMLGPMDDDPLVARIVYDKIKDLSRNPEREIVLLVGHGSDQPGFGEQWRRGMEGVASAVKQLGSFAEVDIALLLPDEVRGKLDKWKRLKPEHAILVSPLFISEGYFTRTVIPSRLQGYEYRYNGRTMLPHPLVSRWMESRLLPVLREQGHSFSMEIG